MYIDYKGEKLDFVNSFRGEAALFATMPHQIDMEDMTLVSINPDKYCIFFKDLEEDDQHVIRHLLKQKIMNDTGYKPAPKKNVLEKIKDKF